MLLAASNVISALAPSFAVMLVGRALLGASLGGFWTVALGAIPLSLSIWMQWTSPDRPEAGSSMFVSTVQTSIALGSLAGGAVVDHLSIASTMHFGGLLAVLSLLVIMTFSTRHASLKHVLDK
ncbi:MFS transporter [Paraburkholderia sediminicola]|uniref:hypothetical protein n=1 Tax=Paraburkholderia sediminicola TaxID=458836 RepID=UPI0038BDBC11